MNKIKENLKQIKDSSCTIAKNIFSKTKDYSLTLGMFVVGAFIFNLSIIAIIFLSILTVFTG